MANQLERALEDVNQMEDFDRIIKRELELFKNNLLSFNYDTMLSVSMRFETINFSKAVDAYVSKGVKKFSKMLDRISNILARHIESISNTERVETELNKSEEI